MTDFLPIALSLAIIYIFYKALRNSIGGGGKISETGKMICTTCGTRGAPARHTRGNIFIELILWLCLIIPGLIYSIWRISTRQEVCPGCGLPNMIPVSTPAGKKLIERNPP